MGLADLQKAIKGREDYLAGNKGSGGGGGGNFTYTKRIQFRENQTKRVRFNGPITEPIILRFHSFNDDFNPIICALQFEEPDQTPRVSDDGTYKGQFVELMRAPHEGCVFCFQHSAVKDKRIGFGRRAVYSVVDEEMYHAVPNDAGRVDKDGNLYINDELCPNNGRCPYCRSTDPQLSALFYGGQKKWEMPMKSAMALMGQINVIQQYCSCCWPEGAAVGVGIVQTQQYNCTNEACQAIVEIEEYDPTVQIYHQCKFCEQTMIPLETAGCSNGCEGARRTTMWDGDWSVTRTGASTLTAYSFHFLGVSQPQDWVLDLEVPDLSAEEKPMNAKKMAEKLGIPNPFEKGRQQVPGHSGPNAAQRRPVSAGPAPALTGRQPQQQAQARPAPQVQRAAPPVAPQRQAPAPVARPQVQPPQRPAAQVMVNQPQNRAWAPNPMAAPQAAVRAVVPATPRIALAPAPKPVAAPAPMVRPPVQRNAIGAPVGRPQPQRESVPYGGGDDDSTSLLPSTPAPRVQMGNGRPQIAVTGVRPQAPGGGTQRAAIAQSKFGPGKDDDISL